MIYSPNILCFLFTFVLLQISLCWSAWLAQLEVHATLYFRAVSSSPTLGVEITFKNVKTDFALLTEMYFFFFNLPINPLWLNLGITSL